MKQIYFLLAMLAVSLSMSAQVQNVVLSAQVPDNQATALSPRSFAAMEQQRQNAFRGSIFTKAPFFTVDFSDTNEYSVGWTSGNGYQSAAFSHWNRVSDTSNAALQQAAYISPALFLGWFSFRMDDFFSNTPDNGFMALSMIEATQGGQNLHGFFDSWIALKGVNVPSSSSMYDVSFYQWYKCSNRDSCFLEYSSDSVNWNQIYINRIGIDAIRDETLKGFKTVSLPMSVGGYQNLYVRVRWTCDTAPYGYYWLVDDISIEQAANNRLEVVTNAFYDGGYHLVPQGMGGNDLLWMARFRNNGSIAQTNVQATVKTSNGTVLAQSQRMASVFPDAVKDTFSMIDPDGRLYNFSQGSAHQYGISSALPSTNLGVDSIFVSLTSDSLAIPLDTFLYNVNCDANGNRVWGRDNGYLVGNSSWPYTVNQAGIITNGSPELLTVAYRTPSNVPSNWVISGIEIVAATEPLAAIPGASIYPVLCWDSLVDINGRRTIYFLPINTGVSSHTVQANEISSFLTGYRTFGNYPTIRIFFPNAPVLQPDKTYRVGYEVDNGTFVCATDRSYYYSPADSSATYLPGNAKNRFGLNHYANAYIRDQNNTIFWAGDVNRDITPMIRMIVCPRNQIPNFTITWDVVPANGGEISDMSNYQAVTGTTIQKPQGSTTRFAIQENEADGYQLDSIIVNGVPVNTLTDPEFQVDQGFYTYRISNLQQNMVCVAYFSGGTGVNSPSNAVVKLQPNPATKSASLTIEGVYGQVEYSLIDINGRTVQSRTIDANATHRLNLEGLARGSYFVRITNDRFTKVEKLIVK